MKKLVISSLALFSIIYVNASEKIKVFTNQYKNAPVISIIDGNNTYNQLLIRDAQTNKVITQTDISDLSSHHEKMDLPTGINTYTVEMVGEDKVLSKSVTIMNNKVIHDHVKVDESGFDNIKFFILDDGTSLLMSHHTITESEMNLVIVNLENQKQIEYTSLGERNLVSHQTDIDYLKKGTKYRATLYSGHTAYYYDFVL